MLGEAFTGDVMADYGEGPASDDAPATQDNGLTKAEEKQVLEEARRRMKRAMEADASDRKRAQDELRFVWNKDNCQWDEEAKKARKDRPMLTENRCPSFIRQATNEVRRSRPQIRVLPQDNQGDVYTAQIQEGLIRNIEGNSRADLAYDQATDHAAACGRGYWKVTTRYEGEGFEQSISIEPVPDPFAIVDDPDCSMPDKSDRKFAFEIEECDREEFKGEYGFEPADFEEAGKALGDDAKFWGDEKKVIVANYWRVVTKKSPRYLMSDGMVVEDFKGYTDAMKRAVLLEPGLQIPTVKQRRDYVERSVEWYCITGLKAISKGEWKGEYIPIVYTTCEQTKIDGGWATKGMTADAKDLTKANNYLLSAQIENIALTPKMPFIGPKGAFDSDNAKWNTVNQDAHAYVEYDIVDADGKPLPPPQRPAGVTAQPEISSVRMGVIDGQRAVVGLMGASLGDRGPETAGIAIQARQTEGDTAIFHVMDNLVRAVRYGGMVIVDLMPHVYDTARVIRIINPDGEPVMQAINQLFVEQPSGKTREANFKAGKYDVVVTAGPAFETQRQQDNALMVDLIGKIPQISQVAPDLAVKQLMTSGEGEKIAQRLAKTVPADIRGEGPSPEVTQLQQQLQGMQEQMKQTTQAKDFAESELMRQKSLLDREQVKNQTEQEKQIFQGQQQELKNEQERLKLERQVIDLMKGQLPVQGVAQTNAIMGGGQVEHQAPPPSEGEMFAQVLMPALQSIGEGMHAVAASNEKVAASMAKIGGKRKVDMGGGRSFTSESVQ